MLMEMFFTLVPLCFGLLCFIHISFATVKDNLDVQFIPEHANEWVVRVDEGDDIADLVASELGVKNERKVEKRCFCFNQRTFFVFVR